MSAQEALLSRLVLLDKASAEDRRRFARRVWGKSLGRRSDAECKAQAQAMFEESGLLELETTVLSYLHNHAGGVKLVALLDDVIRLLHEVHICLECIMSQAVQCLLLQFLAFPGLQCGCC